VVACLNVRILLGVERWASSVEVLWILLCVGGRSEQRSANLATHLPVTWRLGLVPYLAMYLSYATGVDEFNGVTSECVNMAADKATLTCILQVSEVKLANFCSQICNLPMYLSIIQRPDVT
jgi:hypothetical protein